MFNSSVFINKVSGKCASTKSFPYLHDCPAAGAVGNAHEAISG